MNGILIKTKCWVNNNSLSLKRESINGTIWTLLDVLINKGSYFIVSLYIAKIIGPNEFGLISSFAIFISIGTVLIDGGLTTSLIRTINVNSLHYNTVFVVNLSISIILYLTIFFVASPIASFFREPILKEIIRVYCLGFILFGLRSVHVAKLLKEMNFRKITLLSLPGNIIGGLLSIFMVLQGYGVWSLVNLFLVNQIITTILMWLLLGWYPKLQFNKLIFNLHFNFGYKLLIAGQLNAIFDNLNNIIIGRVFNIRSLGFFDRAYSLSYTPVSILSGVITKVTFSSFSKILSEKDRLREIYRQILQLVLFVSSTLIAFGCFFAKPIINILLGEKWLTIIPLFQILSLSFILYPIHSLNVNILNLYGRSDLFLKLEILKKIVFTVLMIICLYFGLIGLAWGSVIFSVFSLVINTYYTRSFLNYPLKSQIIDLVPTFLVVLISSFVVYKAMATFIFFYELHTLIFAFILYILVIVFISHLARLSPYKHLIKIFRQNLR